MVFALAVFFRGCRELNPLTKRHVALLLFTVLNCFVLSAQHQQIPHTDQDTQTPRAESGWMDLSDWSFQEQGILELTGEWRIFWEELLEPGDISPSQGSQGYEAGGSAAVFEMPGTWNSWRYNGSPVGGFGFATFALDLTFPPDMSRASLWIPNPSTAYSLWVNGRLVAKSGDVGTSPETSRPHYRMDTVTFDVPRGTTSIVAQVSNYHHRRGGMWKPLKLGTPDQITALDSTETMYDIFLVGSFLTLAFYNLVVYRNRKNPAALLLGIMFITMSVRVAVTGNMLVSRLIPDFPWVLQLKLEYLSAPLVFLIFIRLIESVYPRYLPRWVTLPLTFLIALDILVVLLVPVLTYSRIVIVYNLIKSLILLVITLRFAVAALRGAREAWAMIGAVTMFLLITLGETFHYSEILLSRDFAPLGFLLSLLNIPVSNEIYLNLITTGITLAGMVAIGNTLAVSVSKALHRIEPRLKPIDFSTLTAEFGITPRETEILNQVALGKSNKEIGGILFISEGTVKNHLYSIMRKLKVSNRTEIVLRLQRESPTKGEGVRHSPS